MLKQRVITALILAGVFLAAVFYLPVLFFSAFTAAVVLIAAWEWADMAGLTRSWQGSVYLVLIALVMGLCACYLGLLPSAAEVDLSRYRDLLLVGCGWWALALLLVQGYPSSAILWGAPLL